MGVALWVTPTAGSHASVVHELPSLTTGAAPAAQKPIALQVSCPLHTLPSSHAVPAVTGPWETPLIGSQASAVQGLPSSMAGGAPAEQVPLALHVSLPLHALPSEQAVPTVTGTCETPFVGLQESAVHGLPSSVATALPARHAPAMQLSPEVQALESEHAEPSACAGFEQVPVPVLHVPAA